MVYYVVDIIDNTTGLHYPVIKNCPGPRSVKEVLDNTRVDITVRARKDYPELYKAYNDHYKKFNLVFVRMYNSYGDALAKRTEIVSKYSKDNTIEDNKGDNDMILVNDTPNVVDNKYDKLANMRVTCKQDIYNYKGNKINKFIVFMIHNKSRDRNYIAYVSDYKKLVSYYNMVQHNYNGNSYQSKSGVSAFYDLRDDLIIKGDNADLYIVAVAPDVDTAGSIVEKYRNEYDGYVPNGYSYKASRTQYHEDIDDDDSNIVSTSDTNSSNKVYVIFGLYDDIDHKERPIDLAHYVNKKDAEEDCRVLKSLYDAYFEVKEIFVSSSTIFKGQYIKEQVKKIEDNINTFKRYLKDDIYISDHRKPGLYKFIMYPYILKSKKRISDDIVRKYEYAYSEPPATRNYAEIIPMLLDDNTSNNIKRLIALLWYVFGNNNFPMSVSVGNLDEEMENSYLVNYINKETLDY